MQYLKQYFFIYQKLKLTKRQLQYLRVTVAKLRRMQLYRNGVLT